MARKAKVSSAPAVVEQADQMLLFPSAAEQSEEKNEQRKVAWQVTSGPALNLLGAAVNSNWLMKAKYKGLTAVSVKAEGKVLVHKIMHKTAKGGMDFSSRVRNRTRGGEDINPEHWIDVELLAVQVREFELLERQVNENKISLTQTFNVK
jgi:hypothetical protein